MHQRQGPVDKARLELRQPAPLSVHLPAGRGLVGAALGVHRVDLGRNLLQVLEPLLHQVLVGPRQPLVLLRVPLLVLQGALVRQSQLLGLVPLLVLAPVLQLLGQAARPASGPRALLDLVVLLPLVLEPPVAPVDLVHPARPRLVAVHLVSGVQAAASLDSPVPQLLVAHLRRALGHPVDRHSGLVGDNSARPVPLLLVPQLVPAFLVQGQLLLLGEEVFSDLLRQVGVACLVLLGLHSLLHPHLGPGALVPNQQPRLAPRRLVLVVSLAQPVPLPLGWALSGQEEALLLQDPSLPLGPQEEHLYFRAVKAGSLLSLRLSMVVRMVVFPPSLLAEVTQILHPSLPWFLAQGSLVLCSHLGPSPRFL